jgi:hypothetical protein
VFPLGFAPRSRANLALTVYKAAALLLSYRNEIGTPDWHRTSISLLKRQDSSQLSYERMVLTVGTVQPLRVFSAALIMSQLHEQKIWSPRKESNPTHQRS